MLSSEQEGALLEAAQQAKLHAHAPWSTFQVGASVMGGSGKIYGGCNIENTSFPLTCCAERVAIFKAISEGERTIVGALVWTPLTPPAAPCGACRQVLYEFGPDAVVLIAGPEGIDRRTTMRALLPEGFSAEDLERAQRG
jgi:cytidine deaminase